MTIWEFPFIIIHSGIILEIFQNCIISLNLTRLRIVTVFKHHNKYYNDVFTLLVRTFSKETKTIGQQFHGYEPTITC
jgi:hypothetical protein